MEKLKQTHQNMINFLTDIKGIDPDMFEYGISFNLKLFGFEEMNRKTLEKAKELEIAQKKESIEAKTILESGGSYIGKETSIAFKKSIAYFEAYLNALYSFLQVITKITLIVYQKSKKPMETKDMGNSFGELTDYLRKNPSSDPDFFNYIEQKMGWYFTFKENRRKITHHGSALLMFTQNDKILFLNYTKNGFNWAAESKSIKELEPFLKDNFDGLFDFLDFYVKHFRKWTSQSDSFQI